MKVIKGNALELVPASHEDPKDPGVLKKVLFRKDDFDKGQVVVVNWSILPIGKSFALHYHESLQEVFIIFKGKVKAIVNGEEMILESGDGLIADVNEEHTMENISDDDVIFLMFGVSDNPSGKTIIV
jgi:quercetin dioxygenase-like cupin family protein